MNRIEGVKSVVSSELAVYFIETFSDDLKQKIRNSLVALCLGAARATSKAKVNSYQKTVKEFVKRIKIDSSPDRVKGMIGELLVHILLEHDGRFTKASPFFNTEERSFKKGFDIVLLESETNELWVTEVKSGEKLKSQKSSSSAALGLINKARNDLRIRLNEQDSNLWSSAINSAYISMKDTSNQKDVVIKLLEEIADDADEGKHTSKETNVILSGVLFHPLNNPMEVDRVKKKYSEIVNNELFKKLIVIAIQKDTYSVVYDFLIREANNEV